mmetsp:Transcript_10492/g.38626  ORF Transcript_10492/g.38626 Transcript_10492/m.38626 type:complete len:597 (+) Transcript_10492:120-1910(+)
MFAPPLLLYDDGGGSPPAHEPAAARATAPLEDEAAGQAESGEADAASGASSAAAASATTTAAAHAPWMSDRARLQERLVAGVSTAELAALVVGPGDAAHGASARPSQRTALMAAGDYAAAVAERVHEGLCGFACCRNALPPGRARQPRRRISLAQRRIFEQPAATFCCAECAAMSARVDAMLRLLADEAAPPAQKRATVSAVERELHGRERRNGGSEGEACAAGPAAPRKGILKNSHQPHGLSGVQDTAAVAKAGHPQQRTSGPLEARVTEREPRAVAVGAAAQHLPQLADARAVDGYVPRLERAQPRTRTNRASIEEHADATELHEQLQEKLGLGEAKAEKDSLDAPHNEEGDEGDVHGGQTKRHDNGTTNRVVGGDGEDWDTDAADRAGVDDDLVFSPCEGYMAHPLTAMKLSPFSRLWTVLSQWLRTGPAPSAPAEPNGEATNACGGGAGGRGTVRARAKPELVKVLLVLLAGHVSDIAKRLKIRTPTSELQRRLGDFVGALYLQHKVPALSSREARLLTTLFLQTYSRTLSYDVALPCGDLDARWEACLADQGNALGLGPEHLDMLQGELLGPFRAELLGRDTRQAGVGDVR